MGNSESSGRGSYVPILRYNPNFSSGSRQPQVIINIEGKHFLEILNGDFPELFEDEAVEYVSIYYCELRNSEEAKITTSVFGSIAAVSTGLSFVPIIGKETIQDELSIGYSFLMMYFCRHWCYCGGSCFRRRCFGSRCNNYKP